MKAHIAAAIAATISIATSTVHAGWDSDGTDTATADLGIAVQGFGPTEDADWSGGAGIEARLRVWQTAECGVALVAGIQTWDAVTEYRESDDGQSAVATQITGDTTLIPIGASVFYRGPLSDSVHIVLEGGLRYAFTESDVLVDAAYVDDETEDYMSDEIQVENTFLAVFGIDLEIEMAPCLAVTGGLGYQWDILQPNETLFGNDLGPTSFSAATVRLGLDVRF